MPKLKGTLLISNQTPCATIIETPSSLPYGTKGITKRLEKGVMIGSNPQQRNLNFLFRSIHEVSFSSTGEVAIP
jgi:hypothetical protein